MHVIKQVLKKHQMRQSQNKQSRFVSENDRRVIRWVLNYDDQFHHQEEEEINEVEGKCAWLRKVINDCKAESDDEYDITNVNLNLYFEQLGANLDGKLEKERKALRNWQMINLRLALYRSLRKNVKDQQFKCVCFEKRKTMTKTDPHDSKKNSKKWLNWS